jgi:transcriptional regulator with XRE-family HTH domain
MAKPREGLQRRRRQLGLTQETLAEQLGIAVNTYSEWERGVKTPRVGFRPRLADRLDVSLLQIDQWIDGEKAHSLVGIDVPDWLGHFAALEQSACRLCTYEPVAVPGLLQTRAYAAAVQRCEIVPPSDDEVERWVRIRLTRQRVLTRPDPLQLSAVIDESVLHRVPRDRAVMWQQLDHLVGMASRPNVELRVLPLADSVFAAAFGSFTLLASQGSTNPYMACVDDRGGPRYLDRPNEVESYSELFDHLHASSLSPGESVELIRVAAKERYA